MTMGIVTMLVTHYGYAKILGIIAVVAFLVGVIIETLRKGQ